VYKNTYQSNRTISGDIGFLVAFDAKHFAQKRPTQLVAVSMDTAFNPDKFNFNKANPSEILTSFNSTEKFQGLVLSLLRQKEDNEEAGVVPPDCNVDCNHPIMVNLSPLMKGHCVVPLWCDQGQPQLLYTPQHLAAACELSLACGSTCRIGFNCLGAFASINHLHLHIMPFEQGFPIERAPVLKPLSHASIHVLDWCAPSFSFQHENAAIVVAMSSLLVDILVQEKIPYNLLFVKTSDQFDQVRIIVMPRQPQERFDPALIGFNGAVCELSGLIIANSQEKYDQLTQSEVVSSIQAFAGLSQNIMDDLGEKLMLKVANNPNLCSC
jgi:GDP-D-glucose phosphorylase